MGSQLAAKDGAGGESKRNGRGISAVTRRIIEEFGKDCDREGVSYLI